jgi:hypothetical protein
MTRLKIYAAVSATALLALAAAPALAQRGGAPAGPAAAPTPREIAAAQAEMAKPRVEPGYTVPRLSIGQPDLQGVWSNASNTRLTRPSEFKSLTLSQEEYEKAVAEHPQNVRQRTDDNQQGQALLDGSDLERGRGYNAFWIDPGTSYGLVKGTWRTSWIVDPPSGQVPYSEEGRRLMASMGGGRRGTGYDNPEERGLAERCIILPTSGPPVGQYLYNNNLRITQAPGHVVVQSEMINDARIIPLTDKRRPDALEPWMGDSIGWWDGDTLVVETRNFNPKGGSSVRLTKDGKITERFSRYNDMQVLYEFEVNDPALYSQVWKAEMSLNKADNIYEYACHEGNYGLYNILAGGRTADREGYVIDSSEDNRGE